MRLIRCYIENFGVLHQYALDFEPGMTTLCQQNGTGKSTLTMFLQTMFYGFPRAHKSLEKDLRRKYKPWQGGEYGGYIVFEVDGETYRLERYFGDRPGLDTFTLYTLDPMKLSNRFDKDIGITLFGLDEESYARTSFIPQQMLGADLNSTGITAGLTTLVENTEDVNRYDHAMELLRQKRSSLMPYRGQGGRIAQARERISQLQDSCYRLEQARQELPQRIQDKTNLEVTLADLQEELDQLQEEIQKTNEGIWMNQLHDQYEAMQTETNRLTLSIQTMNLSYPKGFPEPEAVEYALDSIKNLDQSILEENQDQYERLMNHLALIEDRYVDSLPDQESVDQMHETFNEMLKYYDELDNNHDLIQEDYTDYSRRESAQKKMGLFIGAATVSLVIALIFFLLRYMIPGIIFLGIGLCFLMPVLLSGQQQDIVESDEDTLLLKQKEVRNKIHEYEQVITDGLLRYFPETSSGQFHMQLQQLDTDLKSISDCSVQVAMLQEKIKEEKQKLMDTSNRLKVFCNQYNLPSSLINYRGLMQIKEDHIRFLNLQEDLRSHNDRLSSFLLDHGTQVTEPVDVNPQTLPVLKDRFRRKNLEQASLQNRLAEENQIILQLKNKADQLPGILDQIEILKAAKEGYEKEVRYLDLAMVHLQSARENLTESYLKQIKDSFLFYCSKLQENPMEPEDCFIGTDLSLTLDRQGAARELTSFSAGSTDLYRFCMRLALVDALYPRHKPILILDDPFVNLDAEHGQKAMELLQSMEDQQILYLTCHESRT